MTKVVLKTEKGHNYIEVTFIEMTINLHGLGLCDSCSNPSVMPNGFLIPVLNAVYCNNCFKRWKKTAKYYKEDAEYEKDKTDVFLKALR
ncbi:hypothetical protein SAMN06313486_1015 [Epsilonproteobacteria bacterium SCGC AD-308-P11]|nr:hypothetical protein SAMN06313486_1015 [Epsilonproteobacteria bacterium SCGC AD-308-P11]